MANRVLIICTGDTSREPRVLMELDALAAEYDLSLASSSFNSQLPEGITFIPLPVESAGGRASRTVSAKIAARVERIVLASKRRFSPDSFWRNTISSQIREDWVERLGMVNPEVVIAHHVTALPLARRVADATGAALILNAHEYYPRQFDGNPWWEKNVRPEMEFLCKTFLGSCDSIMTVSPGIVAEYKRCYGIAPDLVMSTKNLEQLLPSPVDPARIRLIHHGIANPDRQIEQMMDLIDLLEPRFSLDFMLVESPAHRSYYSNLLRRIDEHDRLNFISPVATRDIPHRINEYDIGIYLVVPNSFNLQHCLPNKLFEFVQARLGVAFTPVPDAAALIRKYGLGLVSANYSIQAMADELNRLTEHDVVSIKQRVHKAAYMLSSEPSHDHIRHLVRESLARHRNAIGSRQSLAPVSS
jgi:hypothetical protein